MPGAPTSLCVVLGSRAGSSLCKGWKNFESTPKPSSKSSGEHLEERADYLTEFTGGIINQLPTLAKVA